MSNLVKAITGLTVTPLLPRYDLVHNQVVLSSSQCRTEEKVVTLLAHELVHMYDHCANKMDWTNHLHLACSEVRAASLAHCQGPVSSALRDGGAWTRLASQHGECVKSKAARSVQVGSLGNPYISSPDRFLFVAD